MPSFDVVSEVDMHEVTNAVDQANREVGTRFDFKGSNAHYDRKEAEITLQAQVEFQLKQMLEILKDKLARRGVDVACLEVKDAETSLNQARQQVVLRQGLDSALARDIVKRIKDAKLKVQVAIQGDKVRVTGKKKDDLQEVIALLRGAKLELPLQFNNFRDCHSIAMAPRRLDAAQRALAVRAYSPACGERITAASPSKQPASLLFQIADEADHIEAPLEMVAVKIFHEYPEAVADVVAGRELS